MRKTFAYFLKSGNNYYVVVNGLVTTTTTPTPFAADPVAWNDTILSNARNVKYHGIMYNYSMPNTFALDAAKILRYIVHTQAAFESECVFSVQKLNTTTQLYLPYYECDIDFSVITNEELYVQLELLERGLYTVIKSNENTPYEIIMDSSDALTVIQDGIGLKADYYNGTLTRSGAYGSAVMKGIETISISKDGDYSVGEQKDQQFISMGASGGPSWSTGSAEHNNYIYQVDKYLTGGVDVQMRIFQQIQYTNPAGTGVSYFLELRVYKSPASAASPTLVTTIYSDFFSPLAPGAGPRTVLINSTFTIGHLNPEDRLYYVMYLSGPNTDTGGSNTSNVGFFGGQSIEVLMDFRKDSTQHLGYRYGTVFAKLAAKMFGSTYPVRSDFLNNPGLETVDCKPYNCVLAPGDSLRGLDNSVTPAKIKTTFLDFFNDVSYRFMVGVGVEKDISTGIQTLRLEHLSHFYDANNEILALTIPVNKFQWKYDLERIHATLNAGNGNYQYDALNGKDEYNTTSVFQLPIKRKNDNWDMITPYRADMYGIEQMRVNLSGKVSTDDNSDNDVFVTEVNDSPTSVTIGGNPVLGYLPRRKQTAGGSNFASGLINATYAKNISLSPARNIRRNGPLIHASLFMQEGKQITFQTSDKNQELSSNLGSGTITEKSPIAVSSLAPGLWTPILFLFETPAPDNLRDLVDANPYGYITFPVYLAGKMITLKGFIDDIGVKPGDHDVVQWTLLCHPAVDLSQLIY